MIGFNMQKSYSLYLTARLEQKNGSVVVVVLQSKV